MQGIIKFWHAARHFGFIVPEGNENANSTDIYFNDHSFLPSLGEDEKTACKVSNQLVQFEIAEYRDGKIAAINIRPVGGVFTTVETTSITQRNTPQAGSAATELMADSAISFQPNTAQPPANATAQALPTTTAKVTGKVTRWNEYRNFGFIDNSIYFRRSDAEHSCCWLGIDVTFTVVEGREPGQKRAIDVRFANPNNIQIGVINCYDHDRGIGNIKLDGGNDTVFFHVTDVRPEVVCKSGQEVNFEISASGKHPESSKAVNVRYRPNHDYSNFAIGTSTVPTRYFEKWAFCRDGDVDKLQALALDEDWSRGNSKETKFPILNNYLRMTFYKLYVDEMVMEGEKHAVFNTGLVDNIYRPIFALFRVNHQLSEGAKARQPWMLQGFCVSSEGPMGKIVADNFNPRPAPANYFTRVEEVIFDVDIPVDTDNFEHVVMDCIRKDRFPIEFLRRNCPSGFAQDRFEKFEKGDKRDRAKVLEDYCRILDEDAAVKYAIKSRVDDAVSLAIQRCRWNYKTAIPVYNARENSVSLLLPIALVENDKVDLALVVRRTPAGGYRAMTMYLLSWAYDYARLICRPDSDWLTPSAGEGDGETDRD